MASAWRCWGCSLLLACLDVGYLTSRRSQVFISTSSSPWGIVLSPQHGSCCVLGTGTLLKLSAHPGNHWGCALGIVLVWCRWMLPCAWRHVRFASRFVFACFVLLSIAQKGDEWTENNLVIWIRSARWHRKLLQSFSEGFYSLRKGAWNVFWHHSNAILISASLFMTKSLSC